MDDSELLGQYVLHRSQAAFTELVNRHLDMVFSAACRQMGGDVHRAYDVAQMVFVDLARKAPALMGHTSLVGWLYTSTHFAAAKVRRTEQRRAEREREAHTMNELLRSGAEDAAWERLRPVLDEALHELKPRDRTAVLLRFFEKRSFADVGRHLGLGENAARMSVERALEKLGGLLARRGITSSAAALALALTQQTVTAAPAGMATAIATGAFAQAALAGSSGIGAVIVSFMANLKFTAGVAALAGLLTLGTIFVTGTRASRAATELPQLTRETAALLARTREVEARLAAAAEGKPDAQAATVPTPTIPDDTKSDEFTQTVLRDPQSIRLLARVYGLEAGRKYAALYGQLGWTAAQRAQFEAILESAVEKDLEAQGGAQLKAGALALTPEIASRLADIRSEFETRLRAAFGEAALQQFLAFERTSATRAVADEIAGRVYFTATPLTAWQADELVRILGSHMPASDAGRSLPYQAVNWDRVVAEAEAVLAPAQLTALRAVRLKAELEKQRFAVLFPGATPQ